MGCSLRYTSLPSPVNTCTTPKSSLPSGSDLPVETPVKPPSALTRPPGVRIKHAEGFSGLLWDFACPDSLFRWRTIETLLCGRATGPSDRAFGSHNLRQQGAC